MTEQKFLLVRLQRRLGPSPYLSLTELAYRCGVHPDLIDRFVHLGLIDAVDRDLGGEALFNAEAVFAVRKILRLRNELGVNYTGIGVIFELMSRIEMLEERIRELEGKIFSNE